MLHASGMTSKLKIAKAERAGVIGQDFDEFLKEEGIDAEVEARAIKKVVATSKAPRGGAVARGADEMKKLDTRVRHVTKRGANLFAELGFPLSKAKRLQAQSRKQINQAFARTSELTRVV